MNDWEQWVDTILDEEWRLNRFEGPLGVPMEVSYSFMSEAPTVDRYEDVTFPGFRAFSPVERLVTRYALDEFEAVGGLSFHHVEEGGVLQFGFAETDPDGGGWAGQAYYQWRLDTDPAADVWLYENANSMDDLTPWWGGGYHVLLHEIGHALGLKHPGEYSEYDDGPFLPESLDITTNTVMSYEWGYEFDAPDKTLGPLDVLAVETLFGEPLAPERDFSENNDTSVADLLSVFGIEREAAERFIGEHLFEPEAVAQAAESAGLSETELAEIVGVDESLIDDFFIEAGIALADAPTRVGEHLASLDVERDVAKGFVMDHLDQPEHLLFEASANGVTDIMLAELVGVQLGDVWDFFGQHGLSMVDVA